MTENSKEKLVLKNKVAEREEEILKFWQEKEIFKKTLEKPAPNGEFVFYDGPPFATGLPHFGHILPGTMKDYMGRYETMKGKHVSRRWGWDTHGLPIENIVEKEMGFKSKKDIEDFGLEEFNDIARSKVFTYVDEWKKIVPRLGRFVDMENDYRTLNPSYTETVWWIFKELHKKGLVYEGFKSMHLCPHCGTTLSNFEVGQGYKDITDISVTVKFELVDEPGTYFLAWTTTPWTLPGNVALAVNPDIDYVKIKVGNIKLILAELRLSVIKEPYDIVEKVEGNALVGLSYKPIFDYYNNDDLKNKENGFKVYDAAFVTTEDGTGIVHIAPAFGEDDMNLGKEKKLPFIQHVTVDGRFKTEVEDFAGQKVKPIENSQLADIEIIKYLAGKGTLYAKEKFIHSYPHCYRCDTPLLNYAASSWFVEVTKFKDKLVEANKKIKWVPKEVGEGRFGKLLEGAPDWAISRSRFWGAPLPVWKCSCCPVKEFIGSIDEIKERTKSTNKFLVVRHGEAKSNVLDILSSNPKTVNHLTEKGREQAVEASKNLKDKVDIIYCSPFMRTKETADIIAENIGYPKDKILYDDRLHEINGGEMDGRPDPEYQAFFTNRKEKFFRSPKGGETYTDAKKRMTDFLYDIDKKYEGKNILIVSHNTPIWLMFSGALGLNREQTLATRVAGTPFIHNSEIKEIPFAPIPHNREYELDMHRPFIDEITLKCPCGGDMKRIPEVFDCWFESGSMPYAQVHYPFENLDKFNPEKGIGFPADFIAEGVDQTRGWFNSLLIIGIALFDKSPYKSVATNGILLAEDGQKMSKHLKNYSDPMGVVDMYSADAMRYYLLSSSATRAEDLKFSNKGVDEVLKKIIMRLQNVYTFFEMYGGFDLDLTKKDEYKKPKNILDKWILARLKETATQITKATDGHEFDRATRPIGDFVDDLSTWYLRRSRDRFKSEDVPDRNSAMFTTRTVILEFSKLLAPGMPFLAEDLYLKITGGMEKESVHLENWTEEFVGELSAEETEVLEKMRETRIIVSVGLEARAKAGIKVRQPLASLKVKSVKLMGSEEYLEPIKDEVNVKEVIFEEMIAGDVELDTVLTERLKDEGASRDIIRAIQEMRKNKKLNPSDQVELFVETSDDGKELINKFYNEISKVAGLKSISFKEFKEGEVVELETMKFKIHIK
ncbi:MAG: class I tRNA ligase family protein [Candidatus Paceibacterota bacterium]|jgi:isoleucyl-tRNA synthetase